ncbi:Lon protease [Oligella urethralis]|uniref:Lon protease n=1 Tax=Oligella urethralis TaxID=90245 RepID=A0A2N6QAY8_9BURK|nr:MULTISPECIES: endopeptidase La [Oligella]OFS84747.1 endopeptidase La [Oligella sp. HMSC05A10]PMC16594.1 endopeptidase La [Oligella urethralis]WOS37618.1 Lon protease [Oligella urethralis]SPY08675.1 Lon protease [Oligella urethralis]SUA56654.1 Lon protease [Oligella urethralis]
MSNTNLLPESPITLPLLPLRDVVIFPHMVIPLFVGRSRSIAALEESVAHTDKRIVLVAQKSANQDEPGPDDIYQMGVIANVLQLLKLPDGTVKVLVEGIQRAHLQSIDDSQSFFAADALPVLPDEEERPDLEAMRRTITEQFEQYAKFNKKLAPELVSSVASTTDVHRLADLIASHLAMKQEQKQEALETLDVNARLELLLNHIESEIEILQVERRIRSRVKKQMEKSQRDYYLNEQVKAIQKELGEGEDGADIEELERKIEAARMPAEARKKAEGELKKLRLMSPMSAEAGVVRNYIETLVGLPWKKRSKINTSLADAQAVLDADHAGLERVKERILEYLAVQQRVDKIKAPILCLVGPPGVGKTSLGQSIAKATNRKYVRMALGGVRDEAEIRGHRRTYIGAMPGKILQNMSKVGVRNPLFLLDEIDKMGMDFRGDPSSALLEVLDPEQNHTFQDHYAEVDYDLSDVMFVATSNTLNIPPALLDRMEVIRLSGYTEDEKVAIASNHLIPKLMTNNGLNDGELRIEESAIRDVVRYYTREAGVRSLEREIGKICRKVVKQIVSAEAKAKSTATAAKKATKAAAKKAARPQAIVVTADNLSDFLGVRRFSFGLAEAENQVGQVTGLAWTEVGGDLLTIEVAVVNGKGQIQHTGSLGNVMKESMQAARTVVRARAQRLGFADGIFSKKDIHIHVPEGATPKDGPSAGIAITTALVSALSGIPVRADVAMTGEVTLRGEVLAIGGLKEKLLAALRGGIKKVLIPQENVKDLQEIPDNVKSGLEIIPVKWIDQVLEEALEYMPTPLSDEEIEQLAAEAAASAKVSGATDDAETKLKH